MPIRGENIGSAYVRIFADGSSIPDDIRDAFDDSEPSVREGGQRHGETYAEEFDRAYSKGFKKNFSKSQEKLFADANKRLTKSLVRLQLADEFFRSPDWAEFRARLNDEFGDAGTLAGKRLEERFRDSADLRGLGAAMGSIGNQVRRAQAELVREMEKVEKESLARRTTDLRNFFKNQQQMHRTLAANEQKIRLDRDREFEVSINSQRRKLEELRESYAQYLLQLGKVERGERDSGTTRRRLIRDFDRLRSSARDAGLGLGLIDENFDLVDRRLHILTPRMSRFNDHLRVTADRIGTGFGRGSRNNFLNFTGSLMRNVANLVFSLPRMAEGLVRVGRGFSFAFSGAGGGLRGLAAGMKTLGPLAASAAAGIAAMGIGASVAVVVLGPLVALVSGLVAALTALAGAVVFAAIGALGALAGAMLPLAAGIGVVIAGITGLSDAMKKDLKQTFRPVIDGFKELGGIASRQLFGDAEVQARQLGRVIEGLKPITRSTADAMRNVFDGWADDLDSPGFRNFTERMQKFLPQAMERLGEISSNVVSGLGGLFIALIPITNRFLGWLEKITDEFAEWANDPQSREEIRDFMVRAGDAAKSLGRFLQEATGFLMDLFDAGEGDGVKMFESMADNIGRFRDYLEENPDALKEWFEDGRKLAEEIGNAVIEIGKFLDKLDSPEARRTIQMIISGFSALVGILSTLEDLIDRTFVQPLRVGWENAQKLINAFQNFKMPDLGFSASSFKLGNIAAGFAGLGPRIARSIGKINLGGIITGIGGEIKRATAPFTAVPRMILSRIGKVSVAGIITGATTALTKMVGTFQGAGAKVLNKIGTVNVANIIVRVEAALNSLVSPFRLAARMILAGIGNVNVSGIIVGAAVAANNLVNAFRGLAGRIVDAIGTIVPRISMPNIPGIPGIATGGLVERATLAWVGEAGREAVVPLDRPLSQVDPAVRALAAIAQGKAMPPMVGGSGRSINVESGAITVVEVADGRATATEVLNRLVAQGY